MRHEKDNRYPNGATTAQVAFQVRREEVRALVVKRLPAARAAEAVRDPRRHA